MTDQTAYYEQTRSQCLRAQASKNKMDLEKARALIDSERFEGLSEDQQVELTTEYGRALLLVTGAFA